MKNTTSTATTDNDLSPFTPIWTSEINRHYDSEVFRVHMMLMHHIHRFKDGKTRVFNSFSDIAAACNVPEQNIKQILTTLQKDNAIILSKSKNGKIVVELPYARPNRLEVNNNKQKGISGQFLRVPNILFEEFAREKIQDSNRITPLLSHNEFQVYIYVLEMCDRKYDTHYDICIKTIALNLKMDRKTVRKALRSLEKLGLLQHTPSKAASRKKGQVMLHDPYTINIASLVENKKEAETSNTTKEKSNQNKAVASEMPIPITYIVTKPLAVANQSLSEETLDIIHSIPTLTANILTTAQVSIPYEEPFFVVTTPLETAIGQPNQVTQCDHSNVIESTIETTTQLAVYQNEKETVKEAQKDNDADLRFPTKTPSFPHKIPSFPHKSSEFPHVLESIRNNTRNLRGVNAESQKKRDHARTIIFAHLAIRYKQEGEDFYEKKLQEAIFEINDHGIITKNAQTKVPCEHPLSYLMASHPKYGGPVILRVLDRAEQRKRVMQSQMQDSAINNQIALIRDIFTKRRMLEGSESPAAEFYKIYEYVNETTSNDVDKIFKIRMLTRNNEFLNYLNKGQGITAEESRGIISYLTDEAMKKNKEEKKPHI
ncbi:MAG: helix-turn-helix domain-containing protein [Oligoflexia bacterium]|nr:helix-turn-helix domain-containing protein [Oligoflexia bacterium]